MASWRLTKAAAMDLVGILTSGITHFGKAQARKYRAGLGQAFDALASAPLLGREHTGTASPVRVHFYQAHVIVYVIQDPGVVIVRLLPSRADWRESI